MRVARYTTKTHEMSCNRRNEFRHATQNSKMQSSGMDAPRYFLHAMGDLNALFLLVRALSKSPFAHAGSQMVRDNTSRIAGVSESLPSRMTAASALSHWHYSTLTPKATKAVSPRNGNSITWKHEYGG